METLTRLFVFISDVITSAFQFLVDTVEGLAYCIQLLAYFTANIPAYFEWIPEEFVAIIVIVFGVAVTYKIIGREG